MEHETTTLCVCDVCNVCVERFHHISTKYTYQSIAQLRYQYTNLQYGSVSYGAKVGEPVHTTVLTIYLPTRVLVVARDTFTELNATKYHNTLPALLYEMRG